MASGACMPFMARILFAYINSLQMWYEVLEQKISEPDNSLNFKH